MLAKHEKQIEECGIDYTTDTYDAGLHLNLSGAEKVTKWFGQFLQKKCGLESRKDDENLVAIWDKKLEKYYTDKEKKTNEWLTQNSISSKNIIVFY